MKILHFFYLIITAVSASSTTSGANEPVLNYRVYSEQGHRVNPRCDVFVRVSVDLNQSTITVSNDLAGSCPIMISPETRVYSLMETTNQCGSTTFLGVRDERRSLGTISIQDHSRRKCRDLVPARVVVEEASQSETQVFYSAVGE